MTISQNKFIIAGLFVAISAPAYAQNNLDPDAEAEEPRVIASEPNQILAPYFGGPAIPQVERDLATGEPISIAPGPYLTPGTVAIDPFRPEQGLSVEQEAPISFYEDGNVFAPLSEDEDREGDSNDLDYAQGIVEGELADINPETIGLLGERTGGLPYNMWQGTSYERAVNIISRLPVATPSPTINELSELLLLSAAQVPESQYAAEYASDPNALLLARLERLSLTGKMRVLDDLLSALPSDMELSELRELRVNAALLNSDTLSACNMAQDARALEGATYWLKVLTYCRAIEGDSAGVNFNISLLQETDEAPASFVNFINDVLGLSSGNSTLRRNNVVRPEIIDPLTIAMVNTTRRELPLDVIESMPRLFLGAMTRRADLSIDFRAEVSELAALYGVIDGRVFSEVLAAMEFTDGERDSIFLLADTGLGARVDGLLINSAMVENDILRKVELLSTALDRAYREKLYPALAAPLLEVVKTVTPSVDEAFFAHDAGRIALYSGDIATAQKWYDLVVGLSTEVNYEANRALISLWPLMLLSDQDNSIPLSEDILNLWRQSLNQLPLEVQQQRVDMLYAILDVFGHKLPDSAWDNAFENAFDVTDENMPSHAVWRSFLIAAQKGRVAETLALGLMVLGDGWAGETNISVLTSVLSVFKAMGLEAEAKAIAMEALIGKGF